MTNLFDLSGKRALVTGAAGGIGLAICRGFAAHGCHVACLDLAAPLAQSATDAVGRYNVDAIPVVCDVSQPEQLQQAIEQTVQEFGRLDCIINNAGWHPPATSIDDTSIEELRGLLDLNYVSTFAGSKFAVPHLRKTKGTIVNIASMVAILGQDLAAGYCGTKAAQIGLTKALAVELGRDGVRVNAILPGNIDTPLMRDWAATLDDPESALQRVADLQLSKRMGTAEEIARIALFLATDDSAFVTGQAIEAEGGASLDY